MLKMSDIASHAGVSPTTVSFILNERPEADRISEKTRLKVLQAAEDLGYRSNHLARAMRTGDTKMLGILGGRAGEEQVGRMLEGALAAADARGYTLKLLLLDTIGSSAKQVIRRSSELRLMGMLALHLPEAILEDLYTEAGKNGTPLVLMDARCKNPNIPQVISDDESGIEVGIDHLVKLGHTKIALMHGGGETTLGTSRRNAFEKSLARHGLTLAAEHFTEGSFRFRDASAQAAHTLLSLPADKRPTAIFCSGDLMALATLQVAREMGIHVPSQLSVIGFANMTASEFASPALTTIEQPFTDIGKMAVNLLLDMISERDKTPKPTSDLAAQVGLESNNPLNNIKLIPTRLIERCSTASPQRQ